MPASTLRYYESIGVIAPIGRGETSKHRVYSDGDLYCNVGMRGGPAPARAYEPDLWGSLRERGFD